MVPACSHKVSRVSWYSGYRLASLSFAYGAFTLSDWSFQNHSATLGRSIMRSEPRNARIPVWALSISLAATLEIDIFSFFSSGYLDVSVHRVPSVYLFSLRLFSKRYIRFPYVGSPIQISADQSVFATPRSFSQLITSFIGSQCQGIRPALFLA